MAAEKNLEAAPEQNQVKEGKGVSRVKTIEHAEARETIDPELEALLQTDPKHGLKDSEVNERLQTFGKNEIPEKKTNPYLKFLGYFTGAIAFLLELACIISGVVEDWIDFGIILGVLFLNAIIGFSEEAKAESALDALKNNLALKSKVWRNGELTEIEASDLVPGDILVLRLGDIVPADARLLGLNVSGDPTEGDLQVDQSALTGESLPLSKKRGAVVYSSSVIKQGQMMAVVTKTGANTFIGRAANLISITTDQGHFQKIINQIGNFLVVITIVLVVIIFGVLLAREGTSNVMNVLQDVVVLTVAAIPVGLPTVLSVTMAVGAKQLAAKQVIVKRLTAIEEMASVSILCSDKTGTLTLNELTFDEPYLADDSTAEGLLLDAFLASEPGAKDPIESAVRHAAVTQVPILKPLADGSKHEVEGYKIVDFTPFNPDSKRTEATILDLKRNVQFKVSKGAPQIIVDLVGGHPEAVDAVNDLAGRGLRALGVARTADNDFEKWNMVGMISLLDPPRPDSAETIARCKNYGVAVKMVTGDQLIIAKEVSHRLGIQRAILNANKLADKDVSEEAIADRCVRADGFAQVIPEHKYRVVELLQDKGYLVGMTGDGVNDAPALKKANVGIAVEGATDAARSAADIVLLAPGLTAIVDGFTTSRQIFQRMRSYALYRITATLHFLIFFFIIMLSLSWTMNAYLLIFIAILNDLATIAISVDNTQISRRPDKWRIGQLITMSVVLALCLCVMTFSQYFVARNVFYVSNDELISIMFLHIKVLPHFVIFSTRVEGFFWTNFPSWIFFGVIMATQVFVIILCAIGAPGFITGIGWGWAFATIGVAIVWFVVLDSVKVFMFRIWNFELTATLVPTPSRRSKLAVKRENAARRQRLNRTIAQFKIGLTMTEAIRAFQK
ncbi:proton ATPase [Conidiobolus coronatus NRRL 28638]|uniref:Plasma membrane ATPase n=1 Tax=Conidiobolus coronatus (strain ATCC 28846 / CBS 209.66 / NRRL 28638) TaxID=796925 RepID=A0A137PI97_CONC2|nr:proton ATPase [Conidiobolus coronatus NRRL 28638]|eukprot:KXN74726.1 proton ATPase [Conidiobolus coronatus NRRL 28638]